MRRTVPLTISTTFRVILLALGLWDTPVLATVYNLKVVTNASPDYHVMGSTPYAGTKATSPVIEVNLGRMHRCGAFRIHLNAGWPWWDAMKGQIKDKVKVQTSLNGISFASQGFFALNLRWKDMPINHMMPDDETATGFTYGLVPKKPVEARYVRFKVADEMTLTVSEVQVLDWIRHTPFDLRIVLPDEG